MSDETVNPANADVARRAAGTVATTPFERFRAYCADRAALDSVGVGDELSVNQVTKILTAQSTEDVFAALQMAGMIGLRDVPDGTEIQINGFRFAPGTNNDFANRLGVFVVIDAQRLSDGGPMVIDTGVERIIGALRAWEANDSFPVQAIVKQQKTQSGNTMVTLWPVPPRAVPASAE
jgi:hypothetical protein